MTINDVFNLAAGMLLVAVLAGMVRLAFATADQRRAAACVAGRAGLAFARGLGVGIANVLLMVWVLVSWRRVTRNLGLAYPDRHKTVVKRQYHKDGKVTEREHPRIVYPHLFVRPDPYGVVLTVWTRVGIGRGEFEAVAEHLANVWRCRRVHIEQRRPGRLTVRGLRRDPLDISLPLAVPQIPDWPEEEPDDEAA